MISTSFVQLYDGLVALILFFLNVIILFSLLNAFRGERNSNKTSKVLRKSIISYFLCSSIWCALEVIYNYTYYLTSTTSLPTHILNYIYYISFGIAICIGYASSVIGSFYVNMKLYDTYKDTFLSVNTKWINVVFNCW